MTNTTILERAQHLLRPVHIITLTAALSAAGCSTFFMDSHSRQMNSEGHRRAAEEHETRAAGSQALYDPDGMGIYPGDTYVSTWSFGEFDYNPTQQHLWDAQAHRLQARAHREAVVELDDLRVSESLDGP